MDGQIFFITGTDTGVGKTLLTVILTRHLASRGVKVAALKPLCSGGRADAVAIHRALGGNLQLDEINPWHFAAPLAPRIAAEREGRRVRQRDVLDHIRRIAARHRVTLVEGAGGMLSPLALDADSCSLIKALHAVPIVVCPNRLGAISQTLLAFRALPPASARVARVILMQQRHPDISARSNIEYLKRESELGPQRVFALPRLPVALRNGSIPPAGVRRLLDAVLGSAPP